MKQICQTSGVLITASNTFDAAVEKLGVRSTTVARHPIFGYKLGELCAIAQTRSVRHWTWEQRHLLCLAILEKLEVTEFHFPVCKNTAGLTELNSFTTLQQLITIGTKVLGLRNYWSRLVANDDIPRLRVLKTTVHTISIPDFVKSVLLLYVNGLSVYGNVFLDRTGSTDKESAELLFELELKKALKGKESKLQYSATIGKHVLNALRDELKSLGAWPIADTLWHDFNVLLLQPIAKSSAVPQSSLDALNRNVNTILKISIDPEDTTIRAYVSLAVKHLVDIYNYRADLYVMFDSITEKVKLPTNPAIPVEWEIRTGGKSPFESAQLESVRVAKEITNPLALRLLAKRQGGNNA